MVIKCLLSCEREYNTQQFLFNHSDKMYSLLVILNITTMTCYRVIFSSPLFLCEDEAEVVWLVSWFTALLFFFVLVFIIKWVCSEFFEIKLI